MTDAAGRTVTANLALSLDGRCNGPGGPGDLGAIVPCATTETARDHLTGIREGATTALRGRVNAEGVLGYWPSVAADENADPPDRGYAPTADILTELKASGNGNRLFDGLPASTWGLAHHEAGELGELAVTYDRIR